MKQGRASSSGMSGSKTEPRTNITSPARADQIGQTVAFGKGPIQHARGAQAPKANSTIHHRGSQGKH